MTCPGPSGRETSLGRRRRAAEGGGGNNNSGTETGSKVINNVNMVIMMVIMTILAGGAAGDVPCVREQGEHSHQRRGGLADHGQQAGPGGAVVLSFI